MSYQLLVTGVTAVTAGSGQQAAPTTGQTKTLWTSDANVPNATATGSRWKRLVINVYSSHASAASGLKIYEKQSAGATYRELTAISVSATTYTKNYIAVSAPFIKVDYENSANTLTTWELSILGDTDERSAAS
jgi:hypothetical protein